MFESDYRRFKYIIANYKTGNSVSWWSGLFNNAIATMIPIYLRFLINLKFIRFVEDCFWNEPSLFDAPDEHEIPNIPDIASIANTRFNWYT